MLNFYLRLNKAFWYATRNRYKSDENKSFRHSKNGFSACFFSWWNDSNNTYTFLYKMFLMKRSDADINKNFRCLLTQIIFLNQKKCLKKFNLFVSKERHHKSWGKDLRSSVLCCWVNWKCMVLLLRMLSKFLID